MHERIERSGVLAQTLIFVESKQCDIACISFNDLAADYGGVLISHHFYEC
jgi:hypothetical protein